jgi:hypothetical protein
LSRSAEATEENVKQIAVKRPTAECNAHPVSSPRAAGSAQAVPGRSRATAPPISAATATSASVATPLSSLTSALASRLPSPLGRTSGLPHEPGRITSNPQRYVRKAPASPKPEGPTARTGRRGGDPRPLTLR